MKRNKGMQLSAVLAVMLIVSMAFVPAVSAQAEVSITDEYINAIDMTTLSSLSEKDIQKIQKNTKVLKETDTEKIVSYKNNDDSTVYVMSWIDENTENVNFAFINKSELKSFKKLTSGQFNDDSFIASTISAEKYYFWHGSYVETYGNPITGGVHMYLSPQDAPYVAYLGAAAGYILFAVLDGLLPFTDVLGILLAAAIATVYWKEQNSDGSLDIKIPYASAITFAAGGFAYIKIGSNWYKL